MPFHMHLPAGGPLLPARAEAAQTLDTRVDAATSLASGLAYRWDVGDGQTRTRAQPRHRDAAAGRYDVALSLSNSNGAQLQARGMVRVGHGERLAGRVCTARAGLVLDEPVALRQRHPSIAMLHRFFINPQSGPGLFNRALSIDGGASWRTDEVVLPAHLAHTRLERISPGESGRALATAGTAH